MDVSADATVRRMVRVALLQHRAQDNGVDTHCDVLAYLRRDQYNDAVMKRVLIINGPNLNLLGRREPGIYGSSTMESCLESLREALPEVNIDYFQSNHEGEIIDKLHSEGFDKDLSGIVLNAGAYTHTSLAIADAISAIDRPVVEVHISNVHAREEIRHRSLISPVCRGVIAGFGLDSYKLGIISLL